MHRVLVACAKSLGSCPTLCDPTDYYPQSSPVHGIFQARILEWVAMPFSRASSQPRDRTLVPLALEGRFFTTELDSMCVCVLEFVFPFVVDF